MTDYLVPLNRYQFAQFYRYGYTYIPKSTLLKFDGNISESTKQDLAKHFSFTSPFEYNEEYLILHLSKVEETTTENVLFEVQEIVAIYPLSKQAKLSIQEKIDQRIKLSEPIFESVLPLIESTIQKKEIEKAIDALWQICDIEGNKEELLNVIGLDNIFKGLDYRHKGIRASKIENGNYWSILIAYDRFEYFPNENIGYFYDAGQVFAHFNNKPTFEGSGLHSFLNSLKPKTLAKELLSQLENNSESQKYIFKTYVDGLKRYLVAPLFLMLRDNLRNNDNIYNSALIKNLSFFKAFGKEFDAAIILLGAFFGYKKFYDLYYDKLNLRFYKSYNPKQEKILEQEIQLSRFELKDSTKIEIGGQPDIQTETTGEINVPKNQILEESNSQKMLSDVKTSEQNAKEADVEITKIREELKVQIQPAIDEEANNYKFVLLDIIKTKGEITVTNLGKELHLRLRAKKKMKNEIIENILKDIPEIELFKDKSTTKVRLKSAELFKA